ncbi:biosynthetic-type acetolactate synthase large subunit [Pseudomonadota bacterium]
MELNGAEILVQSLKKEGVEHLFGYPGGAVLHIYDALFQQQDVQHVLVRHEQAAIHAADGYARSTGKPGVALVTSGPGATNAVTGIATAFMDSIPLVVFTGQVPTPFIGSDAFQEVDAIGITRPCVKHNFLVKDVRDLADTIKKAFYIATSGRPGPVVIDVPKDVTNPGDKIPFSYPQKADLRSYNPVKKGHKGQIKKAVDLMLSAKRPVIYSGGGVVIGNSGNELCELVKALNFPITSTLMGLGGYPGTDKQFLGMLGMHGTYEANMAMHECDVLIAIGARFDDRVTGKVKEFCPDAKIIHIDIDPASISKNVRVHIPIVGLVKEVLAEMIKMVKEHKHQPNAEAIESWWLQINEWREKECLHYENDSQLIKPQLAIETLQKVASKDVFMASDVGQHQMWAAQYFKFDKPGHWLNSGGLGTMGFGLPAAMGAQMAHPESEVICITGDGSLQMSIQELATCKQYNLPIKIVLLNNSHLGMVRQLQEFFFDGRYAAVALDDSPDFIKIAEAYGHVGLRIEKQEELESKLQEAFAIKDQLVLVEVVVDPEENVYPMIEAGQGHHKMHLAPGCSCCPED